MAFTWQCRLLLAGVLATAMFGCDDLDTSPVALANAIAPVESGAPNAPPSHADDAAASAIGDAAASDVDGTVDCTPNACGGCTALAGEPGAACSGGALWVCAGTDHVTCVAPAPSNVRATQDDEAGVHVTWDAPSLGSPSGYVIERDGQALATVSASIRAYDDAAMEAGALSPPSNLRVDVPLRTDGVSLTWDAAGATPGAAHEYTVRAQYGSSASDAGNFAVGRRAAPSIRTYELSDDDGATWKDVGGTTSYLDQSAPLAQLVGGVSIASPDAGRSLVRLRLTTLPAVVPVSHHYAVRAVSNGETTAASGNVSGQRATGPLRVQWERSQGTSDGQYAALPDVTGANWADLSAPLDESRFYRASITAEGAAPTTTPANAATVPSLVDVFVASRNGAACGLDAQRRAHCWPDLPDGPDVAFDTIAIGMDGDVACGIRSADKKLQCWPSAAAPMVFDEPAAGVAMGDTGRLCVIRASDRQLVCVAPWGEPTVEFKQQSFAQIVMSSVHVCGLLTDGSVSCVSPAAYSDTVSTNVPADHDFVDLSMGRDHACALRADGSATCWGATDYFPSNERFKRLVAGGLGTCGIALDDSLSCWGDATIAYDEEFAAPNVLRVLKRGEASCAIRADGRVRCADAGSVRTPLTTHFREVAVSYADNACGIRDDRHRVCWSGRSPEPSVETFRTLSIYYDHGCGIRDDDNGISCWGSTDSFVAAPTGAFSFVVAYGYNAAGSRGACAIDLAGNGRCWGWVFGNLAASTDLAQIEVNAAGYPYVLTRDGKVLTPPNWSGPQPTGTFAAFSLGQYDLTTLGTDGLVRRYSGLDSSNSALSLDAFVQLSEADDSEACAIRMDGALRCWRGLRDYEPWPNDRFTNVSARGPARCAVRDDGHVLCWGQRGNAMRAP